MLLLNYTKTLWCVFLVHSVDLLNMFFFQLHDVGRKESDFLFVQGIDDVADT